MAEIAYREINPLIIYIIQLTHQGYSDAQISMDIGYSHQSVYRFRRQYGIAPGRSHRVPKPRKSAKKNKLMELSD